MIGIRADANDIVATGHIMRCMTIAKQLSKLGKEVIFFLADEYGVSMLEEKGLRYVILNTDWENPMEEIPTLMQEIKIRGIETMLFDSYRMTKEYFTTLAEQLDDVKLASIDDLFENVYPVDLVINYNAYHTQFPYAEEYAKIEGKDVCLCLGPSYVPLREEFGRTDLKAGIENTVLLSCGGGDILQSMQGILEKAVKDDRYHNTVFHVIVGRYHQNKELLEQLAKEHKNIVLHHNVSNMAELMEENCIAVSAAGTMLYELCAMERPTVFYITADNQRYDSDFFARDDRMLFAGDIRENREQCIDCILEGINTLLCDVKKRTIMKEKLRMVTDGKGAVRIAEALAGL